MKKITAIILALTFVLSLSACAGQGNTAEKSDKISVVTTVFPVYDWVRNIAGDNAEITMLLDSGVDLHSYQPTADDMVKMSSCDLFVYVGGESDEWVEDAMKNAAAVKSLNLMDALGDALKEEEVVEGMETEAEEESGEEGPEYDEHIWLSLKNAVVCAGKIKDALCEADADNKDTFEKNYTEYTAKLKELDGKYEDAVSSAARNTLLFADRFPFRYLTEDYSLNYYAAFMGCSAESEASFETVSFLSKKVAELKLPCVLTLEGTDHSLAETVVKNSGTGAEILSVNSMQSVTAQDVKNGADYIEFMEGNLEVFTSALN